MSIARKYKIYKLTNTPIQGIEGVIVGFIKNILNDLVPFIVESSPNTVFYLTKEGNYILEYYNDAPYLLWVRHDGFYDVLINTYKMNSDSATELIQIMVNDILGIKVHEDNIASSVPVNGIEDAFIAQILHEWN